MFGKCSKSQRHGRHAARWNAMKPSGNTAFDAYKEDTLRRLQEEQENFEAFLERLRAAKDKSEFDQFMDERADEASRTRQELQEPERRQDA